MMDRQFSCVAVGGGVIGGNMALTESIRLRCPSCLATYPMAVEPVALALGPEGATILPGYVEVCPACWQQYGAGDVLAVELGHVPAANGAAP